MCVSHSTGFQPCATCPPTSAAFAEAHEATYWHLRGWGSCVPRSRRRAPVSHHRAAGLARPQRAAPVRNTTPVAGWGALARLAGRTYQCADETVMFRWSRIGQEMQVLFVGTHTRQVLRHVIITRAPAGEDALEFRDGHGIRRGRGVLCGDDSVWFTENGSAQGCDQSGAIYRLQPGGAFERQRFTTHGDTTEQFLAHIYRPLTQPAAPRLVAVA